MLESTLCQNKSSIFFSYALALETGGGMFFRVCPGIEVVVVEYVLDDPNDESGIDVAVDEVSGIAEDCLCVKMSVLGFGLGSVDARAGSTRTRY